MSDRRMMVMVVSLERHLEEERKVLFEAIAGQRGIPVGLPFPAIPANYIFKLNSQYISDADYIFLLMGNEYGALTDKGVSYVHSTYASAQALRKPIVSLIYNGIETKRQDALDKKRLDGFLKQLSKDSVYYWHNDESLRDCAERALEHIFEHEPAPGWRKSSVVSHVAEDHSLVRQLKAQVVQLTNRLKSSIAESAELKLDDDLAPWKFGYQCHAFREGRLRHFSGQMAMAIQDAFECLSPTLLAPVSEARLQIVLSNRIHYEVLKSAQSEWLGCHAVSDIKVDQESLDELKVRLRALHLIEFDDQGRWLLTHEGEQQAIKAYT